MPGRHSRRRDAENITVHYDVSNDFYALWLDKDIVYCCTYFGEGTESINAARERKLDHLCRKLRLRSGDRLLDIGCGWGGLLRWAATHHGITGVGVTLSREQHDYARARIAAEGLADRIEVRLQDSRDVEDPEGFDRIVSVGMYEHVGIRNLSTYFSGMARPLKPVDIEHRHGITAGDPDGHATGPAGGDFIDSYVFPGGEIPHLSRVVYEVSRAGLEVMYVEDLRPHYARTLSRWVERLEAQAELEYSRAVEAQNGRVPPPSEGTPRVRRPLRRYHHRERPRRRLNRSQPRTHWQAHPHTRARPLPAARAGQLEL